MLPVGQQASAWPLQRGFCCALWRAMLPRGLIGCALLWWCGAGIAAVITNPRGAEGAEQHSSSAATTQSDGLALAAAGEVREGTLPTRWPIGTKRRYAVHWERAVAAGTTLDPTLDGGLNGTQSATLEVQVMAMEGDQQYLLWRPRLHAAEVAHEHTALALWQLAIAQTLELVLDAGDDGSLAYTLRNLEGLRRSVWPKVQQIARAAGVEPDCAGEPRASMLCRLNTADGLNDLLLRPIQGFFECVGLEPGFDAVSEWSGPHPAPTIGAAVDMHYRHEWLPAQADGRLRTESSIEPDPEQLRAWAMTQFDAGQRANPAIQQVLAQLRLRTTVHCVIDTEDGWPDEVRHVQVTGKDLALQSRESVRFQRLPAASEVP